MVNFRIILKADLFIIMILGQHTCLHTIYQGLDANREARLYEVHPDNVPSQPNHDS